MIAEVFIGEPQNAVLVLLGLIALGLALAGVIVGLTRGAALSPGFARMIVVGLWLCFACAALTIAGGLFLGAEDMATALETAQPSSRSTLIARGISSILWTTIVASVGLALVVPAMSICLAVLATMRCRAEGRPALGAWVAAAGAGLPSFFVGAALAMRTYGIVRLFGALAGASSGLRLEIVRAGLAETDSLVASTGGVLLLFGLGVAAMVGGAAMAARREASVGLVPVALAALLALVGSIGAGLVLRSDAHLETVFAFQRSLDE